MAAAAALFGAGSYYSVKWWNSLHQQQSTASGISREFRIPLLLNFSALLFLIVGVLILRARVAATRAQEELPPLPDWDGVLVEQLSERMSEVTS